MPAGARWGRRSNSSWLSHPSENTILIGVVMHKDEDMERTRAVHACTPIKVVLVIHILRRLPTPVAIAKAPGCTAWCRRGAG
jgi:hypothetical protein